MPPLEEMTLTEAIYSPSVKRGAGIQDSISDVDNPGYKRQQQWHPPREPNSC